jgi:ABC-2 type transport system ATP-binding protein
MSAAVEVRGVSKRFRLYHEKHYTLKERLIRLGRTSSHEDFWALKNIDFAVDEGETVGLLGHNGSGKSTLLKCIGGILQPSAGEILTRGRLASLLELGAGFHPDLTGRENVYLNASILGIAHRDVDRIFDDVVAFAELEQFIDNQVKFYSSGMFVRLGFAVAVNIDPDVLLVDEVLSVGDENFQRKCLERVREFQAEGRTIIFVTHASDLVRRICDRAVVLDHGKQIVTGPPGEAIRAYRESLMAGGLGEKEEPAAEEAIGGLGEVSRSHQVKITDVAIEHPGQGQRQYLLPGEPLTVHVDYDASDPVEDVVFAIGILDLEGRMLYGANTVQIDGELHPVDGPGRLSFRFDSVPLLDGTYLLFLGIHTYDVGTFYDISDGDHHFEVMNPTQVIGQVALPARFEHRTQLPDQMKVSHG